MTAAVTRGVPEIRAELEYGGSSHKILQKLQMPTCLMIASERFRWNYRGSEVKRKVSMKLQSAETANTPLQS